MYFFEYIEHSGSVGALPRSDLAKQHLRATLGRLRKMVRHRVGHTLDSDRLRASEVISIRPVSKERVISVFHSKKAELEPFQSLPISTVV